MNELTDIQIKDLNFTPYLLRNEIRDRIQELAIQINQDYVNKNPLFVSILNGSFMFTSDLMKQIELQSEIRFIKVSSYDGVKSTKKVSMSSEFGKWVSDRHIIFIEDIIDTGRTLSAFLPTLREKQPASIAIATLLHKPAATLFQVPIDYCGFTIPNLFVVGYGLDYNGLGRNLPGLYQLLS
jgi:hypoxanthine phosphoribosyltransferase